LVKHEAGLASGLVLPEKLENPLQAAGLDKSGPVCGFTDTKAQAAIGTEAGMICKSFGWITSWSSSVAETQHGGRASMSYLQAHPEDDSVHVVIG
jgi:hypothetical protein